MPRYSLASKIGGGVVYFVLLLMTTWATAALCFDVRIAWLRLPCVIAYLLAVIAAILIAKRFWYRLLACLGCFLVVLDWWLSLKPSNEGNWQADVSRLAYGQVNGDHVTIHDTRSCDYRAEFDYTCTWPTREVDISQIRGVDVFVDYWGSPWIAHTILSFDLGNGQHIAFSIEARK